MNESTGELSPCIKPQNQSELSNDLGKLFEALAKAQGEMQTAKKDQANPFFKSNYADLSSCWEAIRAPFSKYGLSIIQVPLIGESFSSKATYKDKQGNTKTYDVNGKTVIIKTVLGHLSGQFMSSVVEVQPTKTDPQGFGSAMTYARRYGLMAIAGIAPDDDDGNAASNTKPRQQSKPAPNKPPTRPPANLNNQKAKTYAPGPEMAPPPDMPPHKLDLGQYVMTKGANAGKTLNSIDKLKLDEWLKYMTDNGYTKGADYKQAELYLNQTAATATSY